ncbi:MAG TPA: type II toxin-antitoxin system PemK/MazF family toxin [Patescibacteria group bacterium]|nr:type II toxin-antitoxin system PemK/MazF family toxin [Patescibacteria group bacterium]
MAVEPLRWAVIRVRLDPARGHEQGGTRRALIVSYEPFHRAGLATVCPITAARDEVRYPGEVAIPVGTAGQARAGLILCQQPRTIALERLAGAPEGRITDPRIRHAVRLALAHHLGLDIPPVGDGAVARP